MEKVVGGPRFGEMIKIFEEIALVLVYSSHVNFRSECSSGTLLNCFPIVSKQPGSLRARQERSERHCVIKSCECVSGANVGEMRLVGVQGVSGERNENWERESCSICLKGQCSEKRR